jgi:hypothetical protein
MVLLTVTATASSPELGGAFEAIRGVGPDGKGSAQAARAWQEVAKADVSRLPQVLAAMDGASPLARNWLRAAVDRILENARSQKKPLPGGELEVFLRDTRHDPQARRLAYELLVEGDPAAADQLLPGMLGDPSLELRRDAVARVLEQAEKVAGERKEEALPLFRKAVTAARDPDQIDRAARRLRELGQPADLPTELGLITHWKLIGPFPNAEQKGVDTAYPPEKARDFAAEYDGKDGKVRWVDYVSKDPYGVVDVNAGVGAHLDSVAYAAAEFTSPEARDVDVRLGCYTVFKLWVNGELALVRGDAYAGMRLDHYVAKVRLKPGKNEILVKVCQADPPPPLPKHWRFMLRVCDSSGAAVLSTTRPTAPAQPDSSK